jgi:hypothetical protein
MGSSSVAYSYVKLSTPGAAGVTVVVPGTAGSLVRGKNRITMPGPVSSQSSSVVQDVVPSLEQVPPEQVPGALPQAAKKSKIVWLWGLTRVGLWLPSSTKLFTSCVVGVPPVMSNVSCEFEIAPNATTAVNPQTSEAGSVIVACGWMSIGTPTNATALGVALGSNGMGTPEAKMVQSTATMSSVSQGTTSPEPVGSQVVS